MDKALAAWNWFAVNLAPWLVVVGIPSLVTALTPYPKASGVVKGLSFVLNLMSALTHSNSPGTMKWPLTQSQPPATKPVLTSVPPADASSR